MKIQTVFNGLQLLLLAFISYKLFTLEDQISQATTIAQANARSVNSMATLPAQSSNVRSQHSAQINSDTIRSIVAEELSKALADSQTFTNNKADDSFKESSALDPSVIAEVDSQIMGFMSDGMVSESELKIIERSMAKMTTAERQKTIQLLARNAANYSAIITH